MGVSVEDNLSKEDSKIMKWAGTLVSGVRDFLVEAGGGNSKKLKLDENVEVQHVDIVFPTFPSGELIKKLKSKYAADKQPVARAILDALPTASFVIHYDVPRKLAEQVGEELARDKLMQWLQPRLAYVGTSIEQLVEKRQDEYDDLSDPAEKARRLADVGEYAQSVGENFVGGMRDILQQDGEKKLIEIYATLGGNVDSAGAANFKFTYTMATGALKLTGASLALAAAPVTAGVTGVAGVLAVADTAAGIANAVAERFQTMASVERDLEGELKSLVTTLGGTAQGVKELLATTALEGANIAGFGVSNLAGLVRNLVSVTSSLGPIGVKMKSAFDTITVTTTAVESRLEQLKARCGAIQKDANALINNLKAMLNAKTEDPTKINELIGNVIALQSEVMRVYDKIVDSEETLTEFIKKLGGWKTATKFVEVAAAVVSLGKTLNEASAVKGWEEVQAAFSKDNLLDTINMAIETSETLKTVKDSGKELLEAEAARQVAALG